MSVSLSVQFETVKSTIQAIRSGRRGDLVKILVGGLAFAESGNLAVEMGADAYAAAPDEAVRVAGDLVGLQDGRNAQ